jgi:alpha-tubulin suppressor-like RCC1 family protein
MRTDDRPRWRDGIRGGTRRARWLRCLAATLVLILGLPQLMAVTVAAFSSSTSTAPNTIAAAADFSVGRLNTWGGGHELLPTLFDSGTWTSVTGAGDHACGIKSGGTLWCWGTGSRLGNGSAATVAAPTQVTSPAATGWSKVSAGSLHTCAIRTDGKLYCWGRNTNGQLGLGTTTEQFTPVQVGVATTWTTISAGDTNTCGLRSTALYCWGNNEDGQVGNNDLGTDALSPVSIAVPGGGGWTIGQVGNGYACGQSSGKIYCWGTGTTGRLGTGNTTTQATPTQVTSPGSTGWSGLNVGNDFGCALRTGSMYCWGYNGFGQFGSGTTTNNSTPQLNSGGSSWTSLVTGYHHTCGFKTSALWCWGDGTEGALGQGDLDTEVDPVTVTAAGFTPSILMDSSASRITWVIASDGRLWGWGRFFDKVPDVVAVGAVATWFAPTAGLRHFCGLQGTGTLWCWGQNTDGRVGDSTTTRRAAPVQVGAGTDWTAVGAGEAHTCGIRALAMYCWGSNANGKVGANTATATYTTPTAISGTNNNWASVSVGDNHTCGIRTTGTLWCWGLNLTGQLGVGNTTDRLLPVQVGVATDWIRVSAGGTHTCALKGTPTANMWCWGDGADGRPGQGNTTQQNSPIKVGTATWTDVAAGGATTCGIQTAGSLWCWGNNVEGQTGNNTSGTTPVTAPAQAGAATDWRTITGGAIGFCGTRTGRVVYCQGETRTGSGDGDVARRVVPTLLTAVRARPVISGSSSRTFFAIP